MPHDESPGGWHGFEVNPGSLQQLKDALSAELSYNLRPSAARLFDQYQGGACFGSRSPSVDVHAVKSKYVECLQATVDRLAAYMQESSLLVEAAGEILARYRTTDALAAASLDDIGELLTASIQDQQGG